MNQIDVHAASGVSQDALAARIGATLPKGFEAVTGEAINKEQSSAISKALGFFNVFLLIFAGVALFVGLFIILNTFTMLVAQRTRELALLRAIGASRRQVMSAYSVSRSSSALLRQPSALRSASSSQSVCEHCSSAVGVSMPAGSLILKPHTVIAAYIVGILVTVVAALVPIVSSCLGFRRSRRCATASRYPSARCEFARSSVSSLS